MFTAVTLEAVADEVEDAVRAVDLDDVYSRSGRHGSGYTEPGEAAWELIEEAIEPFLGDIERHARLGFEAAALEVCQGIVLGLYRLEEANDWEVGEWAPDALAELAGQTVAPWRRGSAGGKKSGRKRRKLPRQFLSERVPDWESWLARLSP